MHKDMRELSPKELRLLIRSGKYNKPTAGLGMGYAQANIYILPLRYAFDFFLFTQRNPKPCPVLDVLGPGTHETVFLAPNSDIRSDVPKYHVFRKGKLTEKREDIKEIWQDDFVTFFLGCSFTFEEALLRSHIPVRHIEEGKNVPMYITNIRCRDGGIFNGPLIVTMRPIPAEKIVKAVQITARYPSVHGSPVHIGSPQEIGIKDLSKPDFGDAVEIKDGEKPVYWACGVTPQEALLHARPDICITHSPGHMFVSDKLNEEFATS